MVATVSHHSYQPKSTHIWDSLMRANLSLQVWTTEAEEEISKRKLSREVLWYLNNKWRAARINRMQFYHQVKWVKIPQELCKSEPQPLIRTRNNNKQVFQASKRNRLNQTSPQRKMVEEMLPLVNIQSLTIKEIVRSKLIAPRWAVKSIRHTHRPRITKIRSRRTFSWGIKSIRTYRRS